MTYPCRHGSISVSDVIDTDLMYSVRHIDQAGSVNKSRIYAPTPWRMICLHGGYIAALHFARVYLWHVTILSGGVDLNGVGDLIAIHWLREMNLEWDGVCRGHTIVVPWKKPGDDRSRNYELILWDQCFEAPGCEADLGKAAGEWLSGIVAYEDALLAKADNLPRH